MTNELRIGIIDDDSSKVTQIMTGLKLGIKGASREKIDRYSGFDLQPYEIKVEAEPELIINEIIDQKIDCVLIDYKLSSFANIHYSGIDLANQINERLYDFPIFILTSYDDELFSKEIFNAYQVFDFSRYLDEQGERIELNFKIIEQILKTNRQKTQWEEEIKKLLPLAGKSEEIDSRLIELDTKLEKFIDGSHSIPEKIKKDLNSNKIDELLRKIDEIIERG